MKICTITFTIAIFLSSCLKQSIPEAMLEVDHADEITATFRYKVNGTPLSVTVNDVDHQGTYPYRTLSCQKDPGVYNMGATLDGGYVVLSFATDSLAVGNYPYTVGDGFVMNYINTAEFVHAPGDSMSVNITSYTNGHISGSFSGVLTPLVDGGTNPFIFGAPSSVFITDGVFENVPVIY